MKGARLGVGVLLLGLASACSTSPPEPQPAAPPEPRASAALRPGETACQAAGRLGVDAGALLAANGLRQPAAAPLAGERVVVPDGAELRHQVLPGETLGRLAAWYGQPVDVLAHANQIRDIGRIAVGDRLRIPPGARTGCAPPARGATVVARRAPAAAARAPSSPRPLPAVSAGPSTETLARADDLLARASGRYDGADFRGALELTREARALLGARNDAASRARRARALWLEGLAHAGLDERDEAARSLQEAVALAPELRHHPSASPRILELLAASPTPASAPQR